VSARAAVSSEPGARRFSLWREELRRAWRELRGDGASPARGAAAVAIGLFIGSQPIFGLHTPLVLVLCVWLRLDAAVAWVASNISNPFFAWALITLEIQVGAWISTGGLIRMDEEARALGVSDLLLRYWGFALLGAPAVGVALAAVGAALTFSTLTLRRRLAPAAAPPEPYRLPPEAPPWLHAIERVATRFSLPSSDVVPTAAERTRFYYARTKLMGDPVARLITDIAAASPDGLGEVVDLGCGRGQLGLLLLELGHATRVRGIDWDAAKVEAASQAAAATGSGLQPVAATFERGDAREADLGEADTVLLIDILHYFKLAEQDALLRRAAAAVRPGGTLMVREADTERGWRSVMTQLEERLFTLLRVNRGERVHMRPASELVRVLAEAGLEATVRPAWGKTPFSNVLLVASRAR
jgi:uncharacterized protein (DUF2062 family)/2-polyprenyl-3-methyl-5-hydroxy-6-metoxy-1,4-benzoquinol methylase